MTTARRGRRASLGDLRLGVSAPLIGLQYGLPAVYNPDEVAIMARALSFARARSTRTTSSIRRSTSTCSSLGGCVSRVLWLSGRVASIAALQRALLHSIRPASTPPGGCSASLAARRPSPPLYSARGASDRSSDCDRGGPVSRGRAAARARLALRQARRPGDARHRGRLSRDQPHLAVRRERTDRVSATRRSLALPCGVAFSTHYYCVFLALPLALADRPGLATARRRRVAAAAASRRRRERASCSSRSRRSCSSSR